MMRRVPERIGCEDYVGWRWQECGRVCAPGVWDDRAVLSDVIARRILAERVDELFVGKVAGDDADMGITLGDEDAG